MPDPMWLDLERYGSAASSIAVTSAVLGELVPITRAGDSSDENHEL